MKLSSLAKKESQPRALEKSPSKRELPVYCVQRDDKLIAISFDAACR